MVAHRRLVVGGAVAALWVVVVLLLVVVDAQSCSPNPCQNGGTCAETTNTTFTCECPSNSTGATCETIKVEVVNGLSYTSDACSEVDEQFKAPADGSCFSYNVFLRKGVVHGSVTCSLDGKSVAIKLWHTAEACALSSPPTLEVTGATNECVGGFVLFYPVFLKINCSSKALGVPSAHVPVLAPVSTSCFNAPEMKARLWFDFQCQGAPFTEALRNEIVSQDGVTGCKDDARLFEGFTVSFSNFCADKTPDSAWQFLLWIGSGCLGSPAVSITGKGADTCVDALVFNYWKFSMRINCTTDICPNSTWTPQSLPGSNPETATAQGTATATGTGISSIGTGTSSSASGPSYPGIECPECGTHGNCISDSSLECTCFDGFSGASCTVVPPTVRAQLRIKGMFLETKPQRFDLNVVSDLATVLRVPEKMFNLVATRQGSIIVVFEIESDVTRPRGTPSPAVLRDELGALVSNTSSVIFTNPDLKYFNFLDHEFNVDADADASQVSPATAGPTPLPQRLLLLLLLFVLVLTAQ